MAVIPFPQNPPCLRTIDGDEIPLSVAVEVILERVGDPGYFSNENTYVVAVRDVGAPPDVAYAFYFNRDPEDAARTVSRFIRGEAGKEASAAVMSHFSSRDANPIVFEDEGIYFWSKICEVRRPEQVEVYRMRLETAYEEGRGLRAPVLTLPISRFAMGGKLTQEMTEFDSADLKLMHHNGGILRDYAAASQFMKTQEGAEAHDRFELGRRAIASTLVSIGLMEREDAAKAMKPLVSEAGRALEAETFRTSASPFRRFRAAIGFGR